MAPKYISLSNFGWEVTSFFFGQTGWEVTSYTDIPALLIRFKSLYIEFIFLMGVSEAQPFLGLLILPYY